MNTSFIEIVFTLKLILILNVVFSKSFDNESTLTVVLQCGLTKLSAH